MRRFIFHFILFFFIIWLIEATLVGSPRQSLPELWESLFSYHLRQHLLQFPSYIVILAFLLASPSLMNQAWMGWNIVGVLTLSMCIFIGMALAGQLHLFLPSPLRDVYNYEIMQEAIWGYESLLFLYPTLLLIAWCLGRAPFTVALIALSNYLLVYVCGLLMKLLISYSPDRAAHLELYALILLIFFTCNASLLAAVLPLVLHRPTSPEELEWEKHVATYKREKISFKPMHIPLPPLPAPPKHLSSP